jgi:hypothetical protein
MGLSKALHRAGTPARPVKPGEETTAYSYQGSACEWRRGGLIQPPVLGPLSSVRELIERMAPALISDPNRYTELWDLDEVFWKNYAKPWNIDRAFQAFAWVTDYYGPWAAQLVAGLQIWLAQTGTLYTGITHLDSMTTLDISLDHPPAIFLAKKVRPIPLFYESYRCPLSQSLVSPSWGRVETYYECFRMPRALADNEPYDRIVAFWHRQDS